MNSTKIIFLSIFCLLPSITFACEGGVDITDRIGLGIIGFASLLVFLKILYKRTGKGWFSKIPNTFIILLMFVGLVFIFFFSIYAAC